MRPFQGHLLAAPRLRVAAAKKTEVGLTLFGLVEGCVYALLAKWHVTSDILLCEKAKMRKDPKEGHIQVHTTVEMVNLVTNYVEVGGLGLVFFFECIFILLVVPFTRK